MFENRQNMKVDYFCNGAATYNVTNNNNHEGLSEILSALPDLAQLCKDNVFLRRLLIAFLEQLLDYEKPCPSAEPKPKKAPDVAVNELIRQEIVRYASKVCVHLEDGWKSGFEKLWIEILNKKAVSDVIYRVGKQQGTNFNRNLVANILYYMDRYGAYGKRYSAAAMAMVLEGDKDKSIRAALKKEPYTEITECLDSLFKERGFCLQNKKY